MGPIIVNTTMAISDMILSAAGLSFIGMGIQPPSPEWGALLSAAQTYIFTSPYLLAFPGVFIILSSLSFNLVGDGLTDALDPKRRIDGEDIMGKKVLDVKNLTIQYRTDLETVHAVNGISFSLEKGETLGLVGETGAGKTTTALGIMGLLPERTAVIPEGSIEFEGTDLLKLSEQEMQKVRGSQISMIFQDPMTALNPVLPVGKQIGEALFLHNEENLSKDEIEKKVEETLELVGIPKARKVEYPYQFSGGMRQRVVIAIALVCNPALLIADEPTTALDVTIQAQILTMICNLQRKYGTSVIMITHDLGVVAETCDKVAIMYAGEAVEYGTLADIFTGENHHPYTVGLFGSIPSLTEESKRLHPIEGLMPDPTEKPAGCWFAPRCRHCTEKCKKQVPPVYEKNGHQIRCHLFGGEERKVR